MGKNTLFITIAGEHTCHEVRLMIESLRTFGGPLNHTQMWVFSTELERVRSLEDGWTRLVPLRLQDPGKAYLFEHKVTACAQAEAQSGEDFTSMVWVDEGVVFTAPPVEFELDSDHDAAFRPVHIRNVGLPPGEPLDAFWKGIYSVAGVEDTLGTITSFVDGQVLRKYFNSHAFSIHPGLGLMGEWYRLFLLLLKDRQFQAEACSDELHQVFLFQGLLSALVASRIQDNRLRILPPTYNYPYNLQERIPEEKRFSTLNETVSFVYEDKSVRPSALVGIEVEEPLRSWLAART